MKHGLAKRCILVVNLLDIRREESIDSVEGHDQSCEASTPNADGYRFPRYSNVRIADPVVADEAGCDPV